jgi:hypothetical protein
VRLARVLDDQQVVLLGESLEGGHVGQLAVEVDGQQKPCPRGNRIRGRLRIEVVVVLADVDQHRLPAGLNDGFERGREGERRDDHLVSGLDSGGEQGKPQSVQPAGHSDALSGAAVLGECPLELLDLRAVCELPRLDQPDDVTDDRSRAAGVRPGQVNERDGRDQVASGRKRAVLDQSLAQADRNGVCPRTGAELAEQMVNVRLDRLASEKEMACDLMVEQPLRHEREDLHLARGETCRLPPLALVAAGPRRNAARHVGTRRPSASATSPHPFAIGRTRRDLRPRPRGRSDTDPYFGSVGR